jgi:hypothetical protein
MTETLLSSCVRCAPIVVGERLPLSALDLIRLLIKHQDAPPYTASGGIYLGL